MHGRHGVYVVNENDRYIGQALIQYGEFAELEWSLLQRYCGQGDVVAEVGANIGGHTVNFARAVGFSGRVVAVEPQRVVFQTLCANLAVNCLLNVEAVHCACGRKPGVLHVPEMDYQNAGNFGGVELQALAIAPRGEPVPVRTLDELLSHYGSVSLIKIDVEGMEAEVLEGGRDVISRCRPVLYVENDRPARSKALIELLMGMGYRMWWHFPWLYNPDNYFRKTENLYPQTGSLNLLCIHHSSDVGPVEGVSEVVDSDSFPAKKKHDRG